MGTLPVPFPKRDRSPPIFGPCLLWPNGWMDQDGIWHGGRFRSRPHHIVLGRNPAPFPKRGHLYCGQTAGCIKMPLGMEVGISPGDFVLDGDPAPTPKRAEPHPIFGPRLLWRNGCMDQDATWYGGRPRPTRHCLMWTQLPQNKGTPTPPPPNFCPMSVVDGWMKTPLGTEVDHAPGRPH